MYTDAGSGEPRSQELEGSRPVKKSARAVCRDVKQGCLRLTVLLGTSCVPKGDTDVSKTIVMHEPLIDSFCAGGQQEASCPHDFL